MIGLPSRTTLPPTSSTSLITPASVRTSPDALPMSQVLERLRAKVQAALRSRMGGPSSCASARGSDRPSVSGRMMSALIVRQTCPVSQADKLQRTGAM